LKEASDMGVSCSLVTSGFWCTPSPTCAGALSSRSSGVAGTGAA